MGRSWVRTPLRSPAVVLQGPRGAAAQLCGTFLPYAPTCRGLFFEREPPLPCAHAAQQPCPCSVAEPLNARAPKQCFYYTIECPLAYGAAKEHAIAVAQSSLSRSVRVTSILLFYKKCPLVSHHLHFSAYSTSTALFGQFKN